MNNVKASHESLYGTIVSHWEVQGNTLQLTVEIPANTSAEVFIPSTDTSFSENGKAGITEEQIKQEGLPYHFLKTKIGSGKYVFETKF